MPDGHGREAPQEHVVSMPNNTTKHDIHILRFPSAVALMSTCRDVANGPIAERVGFVRQEHQRREQERHVESARQANLPCPRPRASKRTPVGRRSYVKVVHGGDEEIDDDEARPLKACATRFKTSERTGVPTDVERTRHATSLARTCLRRSPRRGWE